MSFGFALALPALQQSFAFSPLSLFADGSQGAWYDNSNMSTLFQDSAGTTPAVLESPVGLQLDLSKGLVLGSEISLPLTSATGWTLSAGTVTISGGALRFSAAATNAFAYQATLTIGAVYSVTYTIANYVSGAMSLEGDGAIIGASRTANGTYTETIRLSSTNKLYFFITSGSATLDITAISVKQIAGNHRSQATSANRPTLSARYNLLTKTEQFDNAAWLKAYGSVTANTIAAPDGTITADTFTVGTASQQNTVSQTPAGTAGITTTLSCYIKAGTATWVAMGSNATAADFGYFNVTTGTLGSRTGLVTASSIVGAGSGWYLCSVTLALAATQNRTIQITAANGTYVSGSVGDSIYIWGADLRPTDQTVTLPAYQRVDTSTVYDTAGFPQYIKYNGSNQFLSTASVDFTATAQMSVFAGVRKLSDAAFQLLVELSASTDTQPNAFCVLGSNTTGYYIQTGQSPNRTFGTPSAGSAAPITNVLTVVFDRTIASTAQSKLRVNAGNFVLAPTIEGTGAAGNFGNYPLYFGMRAGTSLPFNGQEYQMIIVGKILTAAQITNTETYVNSKTKAY